MEEKTIRQRLDAYTEKTYGIREETLPFAHEDYAIYRHENGGKWFAVFIKKPRRELGLVGEGEAEILSVKIRDPLLADFLYQQPGYLQGYPSSKWNWVSVVLDGSVPFEDLCRWLDESYIATATRSPKPKRG